MIRAFMIAAVAAAGFALPAVAAEAPSAGTVTSAAYGAELKNQYDAKQAHNILARKGYVNISSLDRDESGRWTGTASKDGKTIFVGVVLPKPHGTDATN
ncbi:MAG: PepSY domain-containing protein [Hyphomicrobium sp.]